MRITRHRHKGVPGLNTTSTADISFMLLIFFLVTTSMDSEKGLGRQLPPYEPEKQEQLMDIDRDKVMTLSLLSDGSLSIDEEKVAMDDGLRKRVRHFILATGPQHVIEIEIDREAPYDSYFHLQNQLVRTYNELRNAAAKKKYGCTLAQCNDEQREYIMKVYPQRMMEK